MLLKNRKALIIIIIPPLALYNINVNWEWRQIKYSFWFIIFGHPPLGNCPRTVAPHELLPRTVTAGVPPPLAPLLPHNFPWVILPGKLFLDNCPYEIPHKTVTLPELLSPRQLPLSSFLLDSYLHEILHRASAPWTFSPRTFFSEYFLPEQLPLDNWVPMKSLLEQVSTDFFPGKLPLNNL